MHCKPVCPLLCAIVAFLVTAASSHAAEDEPVLPSAAIISAWQKAGAAMLLGCRLAFRSVQNLLTILAHTVRRRLCSRIENKLASHWPNRWRPWSLRPRSFSAFRAAG